SVSSFRTKAGEAKYFRSALDARRVWSLDYVTSRRGAMASDNARLILRHHDEVWSKGNLAAVDELYASDFVGHHLGQPDWVGPQSVNGHSGCVPGFPRVRRGRARGRGQGGDTLHVDRNPPRDLSGVRADR